MKKLLFIFAFTLPLLCSNQSPKLLIKMPTRSRPEQFFKVLDIYYKFLSNTITYKFVINCDIDDKTMNNKEIIERFAKYPNLDFYFSNTTSKIESYNSKMELYSDYDIILVTADDMEPIVKDYDKIIVDTMLEKFPDFDGVLNFNDGHIKHDNLNTLPILGKTYYQRFGYIYHPSYKALCCDNELTFVSRMLDKEYISDTVIIKHNHPYFTGTAYDELYSKNELFHKADMANYFSRRENKYYLNQEIKPNITILKY